MVIIISALLNSSQSNHGCGYRIVYMLTVSHLLIKHPAVQYVLVN